MTAAFGSVRAEAGATVAGDFYAIVPDGTATYAATGASGHANLPNAARTATEIGRYSQVVVDAASASGVTVTNYAVPAD